MKEDCIRKIKRLFDMEKDLYILLQVYIIRLYLIKEER